MKREENMRLLHAKTISSKNKACGQKWKIKNWQKKEESEKWEYVCMENFKGVHH